MDCDAHHAHLIKLLKPNAYDHLAIFTETDMDARDTEGQKNLFRKEVEVLGGTTCVKKSSLDT